MKKLVIVFSIIFIFIGLPVQAYFMNGNELVRLMRAWENVQRSKVPVSTIEEAGEFMGFVMGVYDATQEIGNSCPSGVITRGQACAVVAKYLNDNPKEWHNKAYVLVIIALDNAFPCGK